MDNQQSERFIVALNNIADKLAGIDEKLAEQNKATESTARNTAHIARELLGGDEAIFWERDEGITTQLRVISDALCEIARRNKS